MFPSTDRYGVRRGCLFVTGHVGVMRRSNCPCPPVRVRVQAGGHYAQLGWPSAAGKQEYTIHLTARHSETSMQLAPAGFERAKRVRLQGTSESGVLRGRRRSPGLSNTKKTLVGAGGAECGKDHRPYARRVMKQEMLSLEFAGVKDQGQISKLLLARLERYGLIENTGGETRVECNAWQFTARGEEQVVGNPSVIAETKTSVVEQRMAGKLTSLGRTMRSAAQLNPWSTLGFGS
jgi:hypothetical protein